ncbi:MAG: 9-O-acetylesterase [Bacteroidales bacterium]|nr:9-O-acetylesterase [Bacteroidales bacterium]
MKHLLITLALLVAATSMASAKVVPHHLVGDNMVLQQNTSVRLWGTAKAGAKVSVRPSWARKAVTVRSDADGNWEAWLQTPAASFEPREIRISDGEELVLRNVLIGEVWVAGGQSNMEMPVRGFDNCPVEGYNEAVAESVDYSCIRYAKIPSVMSQTPLDDADTRWNVISPSTVPWASATGYFFARALCAALKVPVGIIEANKGGSRVESWLTEENLRKYTNEPLTLEEIKANPRCSTYDYLYPLLWGNGTFNPIVKYTVKGIIFYQGCSNAGDPGDSYSRLLKVLVEQWRDQFGLGEIPFHFVQICPWGGSGGADPLGTSWPLLQEQQFKAAQQIPNSALICTTDCVYPHEINQIHPTQKRRVGERLAWMTLNRTYGFGMLGARSPSFRSMRIEGDRVYLSFDGMESGTNRMYDIQGFEVAGEDRVFHPAHAEHNWGNVYVTSPEVPHPVAVRYAFHNWPCANFGNSLGLPLFPFRTDNWDDVK